MTCFISTVSFNKQALQFFSSSESGGLLVSFSHSKNFCRSQETQVSSSVLSRCDMEWHITTCRISSSSHKFSYKKDAVSSSHLFWLNDYQILRVDNRQGPLLSTRTGTILQLASELNLWGFDLAVVDLWLVHWAEGLTLRAKHSRGRLTANKTNEAIVFRRFLFVGLNLWFKAPLTHSVSLKNSHHGVI